MALQTSSSFTYKYDVYLSFRGEDTRHGFTSHLFRALSERGIRTFVDDKMLLKGEEITPSLLKAIQESIFIIIFSKNYAFSIWCLEELTTILEEKRNGRLVIPVFYDVDPSDLRHCRGSYSEALAKHEVTHGMEKVNVWRTALFQAAQLSGFHFVLG